MAKQWHRDWSVMVSPWPPNKSVSEFEYRYTRRISSEGLNVCVVVVSRTFLYIPIPPGVLSYSFLSSFFHRHDFFLARSFALRSKVWITYIATLLRFILFTVIALVVQLLPLRLYFYAAWLKFWHVPRHLFPSPLKWSCRETCGRYVSTSRTCARLPRTTYQIGRYLRRRFGKTSRVEKMFVDTFIFIRVQ